MALDPIIPPNPIEANVDYRYDGCYQSMVLVLLQRLIDSSGGGATGLATESKQDDQITLSSAANALLTSLEAKDYSTETTLEAVRVLIASLDSKDYATETTLALIKPVLDGIKLDTANLDVALSTRATEATLELTRLLLVSLDGKDFATETTLAAIKAQTDLLNFTGVKLRTTGEDSPGGGSSGLISCGETVQIGVDAGTYVFDASAQTITFADVVIDSIEQILSVTNGNDGLVIFNPLESGKFGSLASNVLTLDYDTTLQDDSDSLYICVNLGEGFMSGSKIIFSDYIVGTTVDPSTTATTSGSAPVLAEMTKTFTPEDATNKIEVFFSGTFSNDNKKDRGAMAAIFVDGVIKEETERRFTVKNDDEDENSTSLMWQGSLSSVPHTITVRFWGTDDTTTGVGVLRNMIIKEIDE